MAELEISEVFNAAKVLKDVARHPHLIGVTKLNPEAQIYLKPENLQYTGSFKLRGAYYKISQLTDEEKAKGVIACSAGNHAQGVALGAAHNGIKATICLPAGAPISKVEATRALGAEICLVPGVYDDAYAKAIELRDANGYTFVHPFDDPLVIAGQGTIGLEIVEEMPDVEAVIVPVGGGGLISGVAFAIKTLKPDVKVYGVQATGAPSMAESITEGERKRLDSVSTIADGIAVKEPGINTFEMCRRYVDDIVTVTDDEIAAAILALIEQHKL
ncbi:MAG: pyridoxal-phosphate dependent enzyme, partial [Paramuribaculum sp.]|nr:pyridoxal-phosphate dependent enzyme [Paramuribaculum sp.]